LVRIPSHWALPEREFPLSRHLEGIFRKEKIGVRLQEAPPNRPNAIATLPREGMVHTDGWPAYGGISEAGYRHKVTVLRQSDNKAWTGTYCKRIIDAGDYWCFLSISTVGTSPFLAAKVNCRLWPVIGVWFAGEGKAPED
jgi:hypothetical protein